ncbi:LD-carboxypeptidase (plasmid) [Tistrella bauzanensis]|uniref:S66 peptidase family protein n=1 Tax=Tistrella arctica TaxID=3133430 RepID=A0ABU9YLV4_9PROT
MTAWPPPLLTGSLSRPPRLCPGDRVGVFAPSLPIAAHYPDRLAQGLAALARTLAVEVVPAGHIHDPGQGFLAGSPAARARIFEDMVRDPSIRAIFCTLGGFNSAEILPHLDVDLLRRAPKILVGYSDATALLLGIQALAGWVTFHGPAVMTQFGEHPEPMAWTLDSLRHAIAGDTTGLPLVPPAEWTAERLEWGNGDWRSRARRLTPAPPCAVWRPGKARGRLFGGNLETLNMMIGTPYLAVPDPCLLFIEATEAEAFLPRIRRALVHLDQAGILDRASGLLLGRMPDATPVFGADLRDTVMEVVGHRGFPVVADLPLGHTDPLATLPLGISASLDANDGGGASDDGRAGEGGVAHIVFDEAATMAPSYEGGRS